MTTHLEITIDKDGLTVTPTAAGRKRAREMLKARRRGYGDLEELLRRTEWILVKPEDVGALTSAPIITRDYQYLDPLYKTSLRRRGRRQPPMVYGFMDYAVEDPVEMLANGEPVRFQGSDVERTPRKSRKP